MQATKILVAFDFSDSSDAALQLATSLARDTGARLHIVHVKEPFTMYKLDRRYGDVPPYPELETLKEALERVVPNDERVPFTHWFFTGENASSEIVRLAGDLKADFIVMGTHGRTGMSRLLTGSVAEAVIRHAECPVLTIKHPRLEIVDAEPALLPS